MTRRAWGNLAAWLLPLLIVWGAILYALDRTFGHG